jgi:DNA-binding MarR family transcriptional regulator
MSRPRSRAQLARETWKFLFDFIIATSTHRTRVLGKHGLSPNDSRALFTLDAKVALPMSALATAWQIDPSYVTALVDRLEGKGLAARTQDPADRRVKRITLTPAGARLKARLADELHEPPDELLELSTRELEALWASAAKLPRT